MQAVSRSVEEKTVYSLYFILKIRRYFLVATKKKNETTVQFYDVNINWQLFILYSSLKLTLPLGAMQVLHFSILQQIPNDEALI